MDQEWMETVGLLRAAQAASKAGMQHDIYSSSNSNGPWRPTLTARQLGALLEGAVREQLALEKKQEERARQESPYLTTCFPGS